MDAIVIIPTYNRSEILKKLLLKWKGVHEKTIYNYEIIFSDDGSTDDTVRILEEETHLPIKIIRNKHSGAASARNSAIKASKGERLIILGDDIFPDDQLVNIHVEMGKKLGEEYALLGEVDWHPTMNITHLMQHITTIGNEQFSYNRLSPEDLTDFRHFYTCNLSLSRKWFESEDCFFSDEFHKYGYEDIELGYRLTQKGLKLFYTKKAWGHHLHDYSEVRRFCQRQENAGEMAIVFQKLHPKIEQFLENEKRIAGIKKAIHKNNKDIDIIEKKLQEIIDYCMNLEFQLTSHTNNKIYSAELKNRLSQIYSPLFELYYNLGVAKGEVGRETSLISLYELYQHKLNII